MNLLEYTLMEPSKFKTKNQMEINDDQRGTYNTNSQINFKTTLLKSRLCNYSDAYIVVKEIITFLGQGAETTAI